MGTHQEATFHGFIHSTRDALLIFEAVRRGHLPKITRRLRDDERKNIGSGTVFVFDEREANIKRWTDGMVWSPSRILNNFLVYREVEKKDPKPSADQPAFVNAEPGFPLPAAPLDGVGSSHNNQVRPVPLMLTSSGMDLDNQMARYPSQQSPGFNNLGMGASGTSANALYPDHEHLYSSSSSNPSHPHAQAAGMVGIAGGPSSPNAARREAEMDRNIVGSLTNSYPFVKNGLCKKTISIQVEGSTQHLISYYRIEDVQNNRLAVPSSLNELNSLPISPIFLHKTNFRYPPVIEYGEDGIPRYVGESTDPAMRPPGQLSSGNESYSSGSESRYDGNFRSTRAMTLYSPTGTNETPLNDPHYRYPHQIGGSGLLPTSAGATFPSTSVAAYRGRRASDVTRRRANSRYDPYGHPPPFGPNTLIPQSYPHSITSDVGGRRLMMSPQRSWTDSPGNHGFHDDATAFGAGQMGHATSQSVGGLTHFGQTISGNQHSDPINGLQNGMFLGNVAEPSGPFPTVPSQPSRTNVGFSIPSELVHVKNEAGTVKQEPSDPFHFSRFPRGSWDSSQAAQSTSSVHGHAMHQPPATSQGLTGVSLYSQTGIGQSAHDRMAPSPPRTSSSHDSRRSLATGAAHSGTRMDGLVEGMHLPAGGQNIDHHPSRPGSRTSGGAYLGEPSSAGMVGSDGNVLRVHSGPSSPYPRSHHAPADHEMAATGLPARSTTDLHLHHHQQLYQQEVYPQQVQSVQDHQQAIQHHQHPQQSGQAAHNGYVSDFDSQGQSQGHEHGHGHAHVSGVPVVKDDLPWRSDSMQESGYRPDSHQQQYSSRPASALDRQQPQHRRDQEDQVADGADENHGPTFEKVMLTRPAS